MSIEVKRATATSRTLRQGTVIAVCYSEELINGVGKEPHALAQVTRWGIPGDRHYGETRVSSRGVVPNNRPITIFGVEAVRAVCEQLGIPLIAPGGFGENLLLEGLGDLSDLLPGDEIRVMADGNLEPAVVFKVRKQNEPCSNLQIYHHLMTKKLFGKRGVICTVSKEGTVRVGDRVELYRPTEKFTEEFADD